MKTTHYLFLHKVILLLLMPVTPIFGSEIKIRVDRRPNNILGNDSMLNSEHRTEEKLKRSRWIRLNTCRNGSLIEQGACKITGYKEVEAPKEGDITVYNSFNGIHVSEVDETKKTITVHLKLSMLWVDNRIQVNFSRQDNINATYDVIKLILNDPQNMPLWTPNYNFKHQSELAPIYDPFVVTEIKILSSNPFSEEMASIEMELDMRLTIRCLFLFNHYPMDSQNCKFLLKSRRYPNMRYLSYKQTRQKHKLRKYFEAVGFNINITFMDGSAKYDNHVGFNMNMGRILRPFLFRCYLPCISIVLISGISFIVPLSAIPGRVSLVVTLFLSLTNIFISKSVKGTYVIIPLLYNIICYFRAIILAWPILFLCTTTILFILVQQPVWNTNRRPWNTSLRIALLCNHYLN